MATKEIVFPSGVARRSSFRQSVGRQERYYSPWSINCRLEDFKGRLRGGSWSPSGPTTLPNQTRYLTDVDGNNITDASGNLIVVGVNISVFHSAGQIYAEPGVDAPASHPAQCIYRDRFIRPEGHIIFASKQGDYSNWDYSADISNTGRAIAIQLSEAGEVGKDIVALIPHKDDFLIAATNTSIWVVRGDPAAGGSLHNISREVGIVSAKAWTRDHLDRYYFLSSHGLYTISASGDGLQAISEDVIPIELTNVSDSDTTLEYDHESRGVSIHIPTASVSWFFDTERQGFWPFNADYAGSHIAIGPFMLADGGSFGRANQLHGITGLGSVSVTWRLLTGTTSEQVSENAKLAIEALVAGNPPLNIHSSGVWTPGINHRSYPRCRGQYLVLIVSATIGDWAWEGARLITQQSGSWR